MSDRQTTSDFIKECLTSDDIGRMYMGLIVSVDRLKKIKRLFDIMTGRIKRMSKVEDMKVFEYSLFRCIELDRMLKIKRIFGL